MPSPASLHALIAHYLAANYPAALPAFLASTNTPPPDTNHPPVPDLQTLVSDGQSYELARQLGAASLAAPAAGGPWTGPLEELTKTPLREGDELRPSRELSVLTTGNLLAVTCGLVPEREFDTATAEYRAEWKRGIVVSSADKGVRVLDYENGEEKHLLHPNTSPVISLALHPTQGRYLATGSMDGATVLTDLVTLQPVQTLRQAKFVVRVVFSADGRWLATASYDRTIQIYESTREPALGVRATADGVYAEHGDDVPIVDAGDDPALACEPALHYALRHTVATEGNPEALLFHPRGEWAMWTERGGYQLKYIALPREGVAGEGSSGGESGVKPWETRAKSFNPHPGDTHVSFSVLDMALHPSGRMVACVTGDHASGGERVLVYGTEPDERLASIFTGSDSDAYVLPRVAWAGDGTGVVTSTPTGELVLSSLDGRVCSRLKAHGHDERASDVVRDLAVCGGDEWEVVSVGYDRLVKITSGRI